jgi:predicted helicase
MLKNNNALYLMRNLTGTTNLTTIFIGNSFCDINFYGYQTYFFPLYLYQPNPLEWKEEKIPNFHEETIKKIEKKLNLKLDKDFSPEDLFDYIYAVLHSKTYRDTYKEFLKIDFPKIPFDVNKTIFLKMRDLWRELRSYHLMENESLIPKNFITKYEINWENEVEKITYKNEKVFINDSQYFEWVPKEVWEFYIWWYQPAQKWLKDRKERKLTYEDILHYSKIILCLQKTISIMEQIESIFQIK